MKRNDTNIKEQETAQDPYQEYQMEDYQGWKVYVRFPKQGLPLKNLVEAYVKEELSLL